MKPADNSGSAVCQPQRQPGYSSVSCHNMTMAAFAQRLQAMAPAYLTLPVVDLTNLKGAWDFDLKWNSRNQVLADGNPRITLFDAVEEQLGLSLELQKAPAPVLVIDRVNETPVGNPPGVAQRLPPRQTEFEVASVKPSRPDETIDASDAALDKNYRSGRFEVQAFPMNLLIATAWNIDRQHMDEMLVGAPKWIDSKRFDISAKMSPTVGSEGWDADVRLMLRALLMNRFRMKAHYEDRPVRTYALVATSKLKLKQSDPSNRASCREERAPVDPRRSANSLFWLITCQDVTMPQFVQLLQRLAHDYIPNDVVDGTEIKGAWDFTLRYTPLYALRNAGSDASLSPPSISGSSGRAGPIPVASEPGDGISLFDALQKQLGLKLEMRKRMMPVLVIDHLEEEPTEN